MSLMHIMNIAGTAMNAESIRLNVIASNLSNQNTVASSAEEAYKAKKPVFHTLLSSELGMQDDLVGVAGVNVNEIKESDVPVKKELQPDNPLADEEGYVYFSNVNALQEMADMISASRSYQDNVKVISAAKTLVLKTLNSMENRG